MRIITFIIILLIIPILFWTTDLIEDPTKQKSKKVEIEKLINSEGLIADLTGSWRKNRNIKNYWTL